MAAMTSERHVKMKIEEGNVEGYGMTQAVQELLWAFDAQNLVTVPHAKSVRRLGVLSAEQLAAVVAAVRRWLGL